MSYQATLETAKTRYAEGNYQAAVSTIKGLLGNAKIFAPFSLLEDKINNIIEYTKEQKNQTATIVGNLRERLRHYPLELVESQVTLILDARERIILQTTSGIYPATFDACRKTLQDITEGIKRGFGNTEASALIESNKGTLFGMYDLFADAILASHSLRYLKDRKILEPLPQRGESIPLKMVR